MKKKIIILILSLTLLAMTPRVLAYAENGHSHPVCGVSCQENHKTLEWTALTFENISEIAADVAQVDSSPYYVFETGNYYLSEDITLLYDVNIPEGVTVNLCLNGKTLTGTGEHSVFLVENGGTLNLTDCCMDADKTGGAVTGFVIGGIFLPVVMMGVHHGLTPIHADMLASMGMTILLPIAAMAGCGQVGASFAVYLKSKNKYLRRTILSSLPIGMLGIGEPLIYGVTLPLGKPFACACIGGAFGGAWQAYHGIGSYALGISGIPLAAATNNVFLYLCGVFIAYLAGFIAVWIAGFDDPPEEATGA